VRALSWPLAAVLILAGLSTGAPAAAVETTGAPTGETVEVSAGRAWTDTGVEVTAGRPASIAARGSIKIAFSDPGKSPGALTPGRPDARGTDCVATNVDGRTWTAPGLYCWTLIARVGTDGVPFEVDNGMTFTPTDSGRLFLGVNDETDAFGDNSGAWTAEVRSSASRCPAYFFVGVRGSGETSTDRGGYGAPIAAHRYFLQQEFGRSVEPVTINYPAISVGDTALGNAAFLALYKTSVGVGELSLSVVLAGLRLRCSTSKISLAGYSQGANVVSNWVDSVVVPPSRFGIRHTTLYSDPRHSDDGLGFEKWINLSGTRDGVKPADHRGIVVIPKLGYPEFRSSRPALRSWCFFKVSTTVGPGTAAEAGTINADPICGFPVDVRRGVPDWKGLHDQYEKHVVPSAVAEAIDALRA
jgi:hypothetical protein